MAIANNELWVKSNNGSKITPYNTSYFTENITDTRLTDDGWTVFTFDADLTTIGAMAFYLIKNIEEVIIPATVTIVGNQAFRGCSSLSSITCYATTAPQIYSQTFYSIKENGTLYYPSGSDYSSWLSTGYLNTYSWIGETIGSDDDYEIPIPEKETYYWRHDAIVDFALTLRDPKQGVTKVIELSSGDLGEITLCSNLNEISNIFVDGKKIDKNTTYSFNSTGLHVVEFKLTTTTLSDSIFNNSIYEVAIIGSEITEIKGKAFSHSTALFPKTLISYAIIPPIIYDNTFDFYDNSQEVAPEKRYLLVPTGTFNDYKSWMTHLGSITTYGYFIREIGVDVPELVLDDYDVAILFQPVETNVPTKIYNGNVDSIASVNLYGTAEVYGGTTGYTFPSPYDWYVVRYKFKDNTIPESAFSDIGRMYGKVVVGNKITSIGNYAFYENGRLTSITLPNTVSHINSWAFGHCKELIDFELPSSVSMIDDSAFWSCQSLTNLTFSNSLNRIGEYAFGYCMSLKTLHIPSSVTFINREAFTLCGGLTDIYIEDSDNSILDGMVFRECKNLINAYVGATTLCGGTFYDCYSLTEVSFGPKVKYVGSNTFAYTTSSDGSHTIPTTFKKITCYSREAPTIEETTFRNVPEYGTLYYPYGSDYSTWLSSNNYYLGYYKWNAETFQLLTSFELEYYTYDAPKVSTLVMLGVTASNITEIFVYYPWWATPTEKNGYFLIDILENDHLDRTGELTFVGITIYGERIEQTLTINQKGIEDMATSIALYKMRMNYPAEGGAQYVQVDYINAQTINAPTCSQSWVKIEQTQAGTAVDGNNTIYQRMYKITMEPTSMGRQTNVSFSCTTPSGAEFTQDKLVLYQSAPTVNPDDGEGETHVSAFVTVFKVKIDGTPEMYNSIRVGYENLIPSTCDIDSNWIHVGTGVKLDMAGSYDTVMEYPVSFDANEGPERVGVITWSGNDGFGNVYTATTTVTQYGSDTPVDEGMIELLNLSVTLPAEGGSDTFQVKYYDAKTIYDPEFVGDWATITEIDSTSENGVAFNGEECVVVTKTYQITAQPSEYGRQAKVILRSDINYYDGGTLHMEKDKFRVYQLASGAEELGGTVYPFRNNLIFDWQGIPENWDSVKVGYKDVTIVNPTINVDWLRIKKTTDKTYSSKEYDYIYEYELEMDDNESISNREGQITFEGINEDGTKSRAIVKVSQLGYDHDIDDDNLSTNYKGYFKSLDGIQYSVSFITNPNYDSYGSITLAGESPVVVSYSDAERLYEPVRTSTCTIKVVSKQYLMNLYTGKAQGTQVILKNEDTGTIEWCGFLQPNLFNQGYSNDIETVEFEASDCLATLEYLKYEDYYVNGRKSIPFNYMINELMDRSKLLNHYYLTKKIYREDNTSKEMLLNKLFISEHNFFSEEDEPWTMKEVLEEACKFLGYVCYQWGDSLYFIDYDEYAEDKTMQANRYDKDNNYSKRTLVEITDGIKYITVDSYKETGADMSLDDVFNTIKVNCNYYNIEDVIPDLLDDKYLTNRMEDDGYFRIKRYGARGNSVLMNETLYRIYDHKNAVQTYYSPINNGESKATPTADDLKSRNIIEDYVGANIVDMIHMNYNESNGKVGESKDWERYILISQLNRPWCGVEGTFHWEDYNFPVLEFNNIPTIFIDNKQEASGRPGMKTKPKNYLVIDAEAAFVPVLNNAFLDDDMTKGMDYKRSIDCYVYEDTYNFDHIIIDEEVDDKELTYPALAFYLEVPKKGWWDGSGWVDYKTHFYVPLEGLNWEDDFWGVSKSVRNTTETNLFIGKTGYKIPLPEEMDSTEFMYFAIGMPRRFAHLADSSGGDNTGKAGNAYCFIKDLKMSICNLYSSLWEDKDLVYENVIDADNVMEGEEITMKITSDNYHGYSLSNVASLNDDDVFTTDITFLGEDGEPIKPEEKMVERYVNQYSTPSIKETITVDMSFKPHEIINDTWWKRNFVMVGQEIDYQYDRQTITLLEKK